MNQSVKLFIVNLKEKENKQLQFINNYYAELMDSKFKIKANSNDTTCYFNEHNQLVIFFKKTRRTTPLYCIKNPRCERQIIVNKAYDIRYLLTAIQNSDMIRTKTIIPYLEEFNYDNKTKGEILAYFIRLEIDEFLKNMKNESLPINQKNWFKKLKSKGLEKSEYELSHDYYELIEHLIDKNGNIIPNVNAHEIYESMINCAGANAFDFKEFAIDIFKLISTISVDLATKREFELKKAQRKKAEETQKLENARKQALARFNDIHEKLDKQKNASRFIKEYLSGDIPIRFIDTNILNELMNAFNILDYNKQRIEMITNNISLYNKQYINDLINEKIKLLKQSFLNEVQLNILLYMETIINDDSKKNNFYYKTILDNYNIIENQFYIIVTNIGSIDVCDDALQLIFMALEDSFQTIILLKDSSYTLQMDKK